MKSFLLHIIRDVQIKKSNTESGTHRKEKINCIGIGVSKKESPNFAVRRFK